jgi:hypothetical protein
MGFEPTPTFVDQNALYSFLEQGFHLESWLLYEVIVLCETCRVAQVCMDFHCFESIA